MTSIVVAPSVVVFSASVDEVETSDDDIGVDVVTWLVISSDVISS